MYDFLTQQKAIRDKLLEYCEVLPGKYALIRLKEIFKFKTNGKIGTKIAIQDYQRGLSMSLETDPIPASKNMTFKRPWIHLRSGKTFYFYGELFKER